MMDDILPPSGSRYVSCPVCGKPSVVLADIPDEELTDFDKTHITCMPLWGEGGHG